MEWKHADRLIVKIDASSMQRKSFIGSDTGGRGKLHKYIFYVHSVRFDLIMFLTCIKNSVVIICCIIQQRIKLDSIISAWLRKSSTVALIMHNCCLKYFEEVHPIKNIYRPHDR